MNGAPLHPQHGAPLRLIVPGWYGMTQVKWLDDQAFAEPFAGYQQAKQYRTKRDEDDPGEPVTRINPRSLLVPPGMPDFPDRRRFLQPGPCKLEGRAWSGGRPHRTRRGQRRRRRHMARRRARRAPAVDFGWRGWSLDWTQGPASTSSAPTSHRRRGQHQPATPAFDLGNGAADVPARRRDARRLLYLPAVYLLGLVRFL